MNNRILFRAVLSVALLILAPGLGVARGAQPTRLSDAVGVNADPAASAPWFNIEVDTPNDRGRYASVAVDPSTGTTFVSYYDATNMDLRVAEHVGSGGNCGPNNDWHCQVVDSGEDAGKYSSIAINPVAGTPGIAYHDAEYGRLNYAYEVCVDTVCSWVVHAIDEGTLSVSSAGLYTSLKYHSDGTPYIAYYLENSSGVDALMVASYVGSEGNCGHGTATGWWQCDTIQTGEGVGQYASLALDGAGNRHIAYYDAGNGDLWYASSSTGSNCGPGGNTWLCYAVSTSSDVGQYASLYVDSGNHFHIAYYDATAEMLKYAVDKGTGGNCGEDGSAQCDEIDPMQTGDHPLGVSLAEDGTGYPIVAYQSEDASLNVARPIAALGLSAGGGNCGPEDPLTWYCETIDPSGQLIRYRNGDFVSIALSSSGLATIAYYGFITSSDGNLMVSYQGFRSFLPLVMENQ